MALARQKFREIILQMLYSKIYVVTDGDMIISFMMKQLKTTKKNIVEALNFTNKIFEKVSLLDSEIEKAVISYDFDRISKVELSILRIALYEIMFVDEIPFKVVIAEAIRLTKKFANMQSVSFINAVIDSVYNQKYGSLQK